MKEEINKPNMSKSRIYPNITDTEKEALEELKLRAGRDLIIMPADKGGGTCVLSRDDYIAEADRQLSDTNTYQILNGDVTTRSKEK